MNFSEPHRKSVLDVLKNNFKHADRVTYVHRIIYIGEHSFKQEGPGPLITDVMQNNINSVNGEFYDEKLTGLLLYYASYFCHILDGSEKSLLKHLRRLRKDEQANKNIGKTKLLTTYHHINRRFFNDWFYYSGKPPTLLEKTEPNSDLKTTYRYVYNCIKKLYSLATTLGSFVNKESDENDNNPNRSSQDRSKAAILQTLTTGVRMIDCLPEYSLLEFLLNSSYTEDLQPYIDAYYSIPELQPYKDAVWPVPTSFVPINVFERFSNPIEDLPPRETADAKEQPQPQ